MSASAVFTSGANTTSTGTPSWRSFAIASGGLKLLPPAITRSVPMPTIFSTSTEPNLATSGTSATSGGKGVNSSTLPTTLSPTPSANRISVAALVIDAILVGAAGSVTSVPSSSVSVSGKVGAGVGVAVGASVGSGVATDGAGVAEASAAAVALGLACGRRTGREHGGEQEEQQGGERAAATVTRRAGTCVHGNSGCGEEETKDPSLRDEGGVRRLIARCA